MDVDGRPHLALLELHLRERPDCPLPLFVRSWLLKAIARHRLEGADLAAALGLRLPGRYSVATRDSRERRDTALRAAGSLLGNDAHALAAALRRFASSRWPRWRAYPFPPAEAPDLDRVLFDVFHEDADPPTSPKQLRRILGTTATPS